MNSEQKRILAAYEDTGHTVRIYKRRTGKIEVSLNGFPARSVAEAVAIAKAYFIDRGLET